MPKIKWSQFNNAGNIQAGDIVVGLRAGTNVQLNPVTAKQVQSSFFNYSLATGANDAFIATLGPTVTSYTDGLLVTLNTQALTNLTGTPTLQVNALAPKTIVFNNLQLIPGDLETNNTYVFVYNINTDTFNLINPSISIANTQIVQQNDYNAAADTGIVNAYIANLTPPIDSLTGYLTVLCQVVNANTGASTLTVNGHTAPIVTANNQALVGGELIANQVGVFLYDPTWASFILVNPAIMTVGVGGTGNTTVGANGTLAQSDGSKYTFTTATYPSTTQKWHLLYSSNNNVVDEITHQKNAVLVCDNNREPNWSSSMTDGQIIIGKTNDSPAAANLTAGTGITITNGANSITIASSGIAIGWSEVNTTTKSMAVNNGYIATSNNVSQLVFTLPIASPIGSTISIIGKGAGGWKVNQNAGQSIQFGTTSTTVTTGYIASSNQFDTITLVCTTENTIWTVLNGPQGNITIT